ncbi:hypothetical protein [Natronobacterium lacisalsi]|nr:hypothetical protein [Halobiforma lacisalsi]
MPHIKGMVHGFAAMATLIVGSILTDVVSEHAAVFRELSALSIELLTEVGRLPVDEEVAGIVVPVGILMGIWVFLFELRQVTK